MIDLPSALAESGAYPPDKALPGSTRQFSLPLVCHHLPKDTKLELGRGAHLGNTILNQPYRRHVSTDRLNREDMQLAASLEGEPGRTPAGKTLPHSYPETRFRSERARDMDYIISAMVFLVMILTGSCKTLHNIEDTYLGQTCLLYLAVSFSNERRY